MTFRTIALATLIVAGFAMKANAETKIYDLSGFDEVEANSGVTVFVSVGPDFAVNAEAVRGDLDNLVLEVKAGRLEIGRETGFSLLGFGRNDDFVVDVTMPEIKQAEVTSGATLTIYEATTALTRGQSTSGATLIILGELLGNINLEATSGSSLRAEGGCDELDAEATSGSSLRIADLECRSGEINATSGASLSAHLTDRVDISASSGASIDLFGGPEVATQDISSGASLTTH